MRSGIGPWYADYLPTTTWEGDNYMLTQQVARYVSPSLRFYISQTNSNKASQICPLRSQ
jgi:acyl-CoA oxidase